MEEAVTITDIGANWNISINSNYNCSLAKLTQTISNNNRGHHLHIPPSFNAMTFDNQPLNEVI